MDRIIRFGIFGCGMISNYHADAIQRVNNAVLVGAFDQNENSMRQFCDKYKIKSFQTREEFLKSDEIDVVCICLPSGLHYEVALKCLQNKKHVLVEKPMAISVADTDDLIRVATENEVFIGVVSQLRYTDAAKKVKEIIKSGKLGKTTLGNAIMKYYRSPEYYENGKWRGTWEMDGGGALMNQGIHGIDLLQYFMGPVKSVFAVAKTLVHDIQTEDTLTAVLEYENDAIGVVQATTSVYPGYDRKIEICGSAGTVVLSENTIEVCDVEGFESYADNTMAKEQPDTASRPDGMDCSLHAEQIQDFVNSIINAQTPWIDGVEGKKAVEIICAIYESAKSGKKIYLNK